MKIEKLFLNHSRTDPFFRIPGTAGRILLKSTEFGDQLAMCFVHVICVVHLHIRTCIPIFHISGTATRIVQNSKLWLEGPLTICFTLEGYGR